MGQRPKMAPCPKADSFWEFVLSPATPTFNTIGFSFSSVTLAHTWTTSVHTHCAPGVHQWELPLYMGFSGDEGFTGDVRCPVLAWP